MLPAVQAARGLRPAVVMSKFAEADWHRRRRNMFRRWAAIRPADKASSWTGDPDQAGMPRTSPAAGYYNLLPYIDQQVLHDYGMLPVPTQTPNVGPGAQYDPDGICLSAKAATWFA